MQKELEKIIKHSFKDQKLLTMALTHSSYANEHRISGNNSNERLEFLGDSVLGLVAADYLFNENRNKPEGDLTKMRASLVCEPALYNYARSIDLGNYLLLGNGEEASGGRTRPSILADAFEALIAAIYLESGMETAKQFILPFLKKQINASNGFDLTKDYKTALQEIAQKNPGEIIKYVVVGEKGPDHNKQFEVDVYLNSNKIGCGNGKSKKEAEQIAAKQALLLMGEDV